MVVIAMRMKLLENILRLERVVPYRTYTTVRIYPRSVASSKLRTKLHTGIWKLCDVRNSSNVWKTFIV
jgi:hypothetical protein